MKETVDFFSTNTLLGLGAIILSLSYLWSVWKDGAGKASKELLETLKAQYETQRKINEDLQKQMNAMRQELGRLQGVNEQNEKKIKEYMDIIANRSPLLEKSIEELLKVGKETRQYMIEGRKFMKSFQKGGVK